MSETAGSAIQPSSGKTADMAQSAWIPLLIIVLAQLQMGINVNALPVSIGPIAEDLLTPTTAIATALVIYSLVVAACVMLGAKLGKMIGERRVFQVAVLAHGGSMVLMALATDQRAMNVAQVIAGIAAAALVPTLVVLIAANYRGRQQETALGVLAAVPALASALTFVVAGALATAFTWRYSFGLTGLLAAAVFILSFRLKPVDRQKGMQIDVVGWLLSAASLALILFGFNSIGDWGLFSAEPDAPFSIVGISPSPLLILIGLILGQTFFKWSRKRAEAGRQPLIAMEVLDSSEERNAVICFLVAGSLGPAASFLIPLYIQIVQDRSPLFTSVAIVPYAIAIAAAAVLSVRLYDRIPPRQIGIVSFLMVAAGLALVGMTVANNWGNPSVILGLLIVGLGEGALLTLLFNVLVSASPKELAGDVGALRGVANNVSSALGGAFAGVFAVGLLGIALASGFNASTLPLELRDEMTYKRIDFVTNNQLEEYLSETSATARQVTEAVKLNEDARLRALRASFIVLAGIALLAVIPASGLPKYVPDELSAEEIVGQG
ncbi:MAG: MFS transporter [Thermomicrobiales bacterium]|nr:MFS transporter [Thermomicrobiales bacterium]